MSGLPVDHEVQRFRSLLARRLGLWFDDGKLGLLAEMLCRRAARNRMEAASYLIRLEHPAMREELRSLAQELTVTETYFFRHAAQLHAFSEQVLRGGSATAPRRLRLLSAGCASGEEAYSLAMLVREQLHEAAGWEVSIRGIDINCAMLERAARARYSQWSLRDTSAAFEARWFAREGGELLLDSKIRSMVKFEERNLTEDADTFWEPEAFDVVFCRNVLMYFTPEAARAVVARIARSLVPGGFLFLGHAETLRGVSQDFHLRHTHEAFYYQRREGPAATARAAELRELAAPPSVPMALVSSLDALPWVEAIQLSSERVRQLTEPANGAQAEPESAPQRAPQVHAGGNLAIAVELLRKEQFAEIRSMLSALPVESAHDPDVLLLRAVLLTHGGDLALAEGICAELLELDESNAGARYLMALCREHAGELRAAADHDQIAVYLDPTFAMPRLHLGLMARRTGDARSARGELSQALTLLELEDPSRLLLFGGGFSRQALIALCRAELAACGGSA